MRGSRRGARDLQDLGPVTVGGIELSSPFMTASGTAGHDIELNSYMPMNKLGATVAKSLFHEPWPGNPAPRVHLARGGMMNAVGLQGPGAATWVNESLPRCEAAGVTVVASIWGRTVAEYVAAAQQLAVANNRIAAIEINLSCPNLEGRSGIIAHDASLSARIVAEVSQCVSVPVWAKLSANTDRIVEVAEAVSTAGAQAVTLINTMLGLQVDVTSARPTLGNGGGGLSGSSIHPIAVRAVHDVRVALPHVHIIGVGGVSSGDDAIEMMLVGANAVQVGTASFLDPSAAWKIACHAARRAVQNGASTWSDVVGALHQR
ncbi:MAG: dihydroorotate dehydrogenase [Ilumatobacteraceae bacterium]